MTSLHHEPIPNEPSVWDWLLVGWASANGKKKSNNDWTGRHEFTAELVPVLDVWTGPCGLSYGATRHSSTRLCTCFASSSVPPLPSPLLVSMLQGYDHVTSPSPCLCLALPLSLTLSRSSSCLTLSLSHCLYVSNCPVSYPYPPLHMGCLCPV